MHHLKSASLIALSIALATPTGASAQAAQRYDIAAQDLSAALKLFAGVSGREVVVSSDVVAGKRAHAATGDLSAEAALDQLLVGTGLRASVVDGSFVIRPTAFAEDTGPNDSIVVTGTRIRGAGPVGSPVVIIDRKEIDRSGRATVAEMAQTIPQNFGGGQNEATVGTTVRNGANENQSYGSSINLRGLGAASTLILFDGIRPPLAGANGTFADISLLPATALERIELLTDGASAIYGSDAVAGVVNLRFRNRFEGVESRFRIASADGDYTDVQLGQLAGTRWSTGGVMIALEYSHRDTLPASARRFVSEDLRPFGGPDNRSLYSAPGTIIAADGRIFGIPAGQDGTRLTPAQLIPAQQNRFDQQQRYSLLPEQETMSGYLAVDQEIASNASLFVRALVARREYAANVYKYGQSMLTVPVTNPFYVDPIGTRQPIRVQYDLQNDFGAEGIRGAIDALSVVGGLKARLAGWTIEIDGTYGRQLENNSNTNIVNTARLMTALADTNPVTAFNVFGPGGNNNPATIAAIRGGYITRAESQSWGGAIRVDGTLITLPAGAAKLAFGVERRDDRLSYDITTDRTATIQRATINGLPGHRVVTAAYGELLLPLLSDAVAGWFPGQLEASVAGRVERYTDVGETANPKLGVQWHFPGGFTMRGSYGTSFRAPYFRELVGSGQNLYQTFVLPNPQSPTGTTPVIVLFGFPDDLGPERARTTTLGFDFRPSAVPGLSVSATWFRIDYRDRIASASLDLFNYFNKRTLYAGLIQDAPSATLVASYYANPLFRNPSNIAPGSIGAIVNGYTMNLARVVLNGLDFDVGYTRPVFGGTGAVGIAGTHYVSIDQQVTANAPSADVAGMLGSPSKFRFTGRANWANDRMDIGAVVNYTDSYTNQLVTPSAAVRAQVTVDAHIGVSVPVSDGRRLRLQLAATNIFDRDPPFVVNPTANSTLGYDPEQASAIGRLISLQAIMSW